jgi:phospholipid transport system substrate-binding protein
MLKQGVTIIIVGLLMISTAFAGVTGDVKNSVDELFRIVSDKKMKNNGPERRQALNKVINVIFDYSEMSKRSLGKHWNERTPDERREFIDLFALLLQNSYLSKIESYNNEKIVYLKETLDDKYAEIKSKIVTAKRDEYTLDYRLLNENGKWMVYDIVIEGVSMVSNYRAQFNRVINDKGYSGLVKVLQTKKGEIRAS